MPQFDTFIFSSSLFYFILSFLIVLYGNHVKFLPRLSSILKLRHKVSNKSITIQDSDISSFVSGFNYTNNSHKY